MRLRAPVLGHDLVAMAAPFTKWSVQVERADEMAAILHRAFKIAQTRRRGPSSWRCPSTCSSRRRSCSRCRRSRSTRSRARSERRRRRRRPVDPMPAPRHRRRRRRGPPWRAGRAGRARRPPRRAGVGRGPPPALGFPSSQPPTAAASVRRRRDQEALDGADAVLLVGGPFFEEVWFAHGSPSPPRRRRADRGHPRASRRTSRCGSACSPPRRGAARTPRQARARGGAEFRRSAGERRPRSRRRRRGSETACGRGRPSGGTTSPSRFHG